MAHAKPLVRPWHGSFGGRVLVGVVAAAWLLFTTSCRPLCDGQDGRCLDLQLDGEGTFARLTLRLSGDPLSAGLMAELQNDPPQAAQLPLRLRVLPDDSAIANLSIGSLDALAFVGDNDVLPTRAGKLTFAPLWLPGEVRSASLYLDTVPSDIGGIFNPYAPPALTKLAPHCGPLGGGITVQIAGSNLSAETRISFGNRPATNIRARNGGLAVTVPIATAAGPVTVSAHNISSTAVSAPTKFVYRAGPASFWTQPIDLSMLASPAVSIIAADLNGDGLDDLVVGTADTGGDAGKILPLLSTTDPTIWRPGTKSPTGLLNVQSIAAADFDGDQRLDLVVGGHSTSVATLLGTSPPGSFAPFTTVASGGTQIYGAIPAQLGGSSGWPDLVTLDYNGGAFHVLPHQTHGTFGAPTASGDCAGLTSIYSLATGDLNGDGRMDLIGTSYVTDALRVCLANPSGTGFTTLPPVSVGATNLSGDPQFVALGDMDGDGNLDLAAAPGDGVVVQFGDGTGKFNPHPSSPMLPGRVYGLQVGDVNCDGQTALLALVDNGAVKMDLWLAECTRTSCTRTKLSTSALDRPTPSMLSALAVGDWNGDGLTDLAVLGNGQIVLFYQNP